MEIPSRRAAGVAGVVAGGGLALEFALFLGSGWTPETFADPSAALAFFDAGGTVLRAAALMGITNLGFTAIFLAGLAGALRRVAPTLAATVLYPGLLGLAAHGLVPLGLWLAPGTFVDLHARSPELAFGAWGGFSAFLDAAGGLGALFGGGALVAAGSALLMLPQAPRGLAWTGLLGGGASALVVLGTDTPLESVTTALYMPSLVLIMTFRFWGGLTLWRGSTSTAPAGARSP